MRMVAQHLFTLGEVDEVNWKRTDVEGYLTGAQSLLNCEIGTTGLAKKRKGTVLNLSMNMSQYDPNCRFYEYRDILGNYYIIQSGIATFYVYQINPLTNFATFFGALANATPYTSAELPQIDYTLNGDSLVLSHPNHPPARIFISNYTLFAFTYQVIAINPYPAYDFGVNNYNNAAVVLAVVGGNTNTLTLTVTGTYTFDSSWIGGQIIGAGNSPEQPVGSGFITNVVNSGSSTVFSIAVQVPFDTANPAVSGSQYSIRQPAWSNALGYPAKVITYQNRLWFANTRQLPSTVLVLNWASLTVLIQAQDWTQTPLFTQSDRPERAVLSG